MFIFGYSSVWADLVTMQMRSVLGPNPATWGYACLCIGREIDTLLEDNYEAVDAASGDFLHLFSLRPPPKAFLATRIREAQFAGHHALADALQRGTQCPKDRGQQVAEKVRLLRDLASAGLRADQYADFLFFDFQQDGETYDVDVIAAKAAPSLKDEQGVLSFFRGLSQKAHLCAAKGQSAEQFVASATLSWDAKVALQRTGKLGEYVAKFIDRARPK